MEWEEDKLSYVVSFSQEQFTQLLRLYHYEQLNLFLVTFLVYYSQLIKLYEKIDLCYLLSLWELDGKINTTHMFVC